MPAVNRGPKSAYPACTYTVGICEETNTRHDGKPEMIPSERRLVDFGKSHATPFIGIRDMGLRWLAWSQGEV